MEFLRYIPKNWLSRAVGEIVSLENPQFVAHAARDWFIKRFSVDITEAEMPLDNYPSISKLFTRRLKPGLRPIGEGIVHPCDGALTVAQIIESETLIQAKGRSYSLTELLYDETSLDKYAGGIALTYYLCPTDYHRVHSPIDGEIERVVHVPGALWPVNSWSVNNIDNLFARNERVIFHYKTALGPMALVMVGATNVGKITVSFDNSFKTNLSRRGVKDKLYIPTMRIKKGDEIGIFNMGSTVVLIYPQKLLNIIPRLGKVRLGQSLHAKMP